MATYQYIASSDATKKTTKGTIEASDEAAVMEMLKKQNLRPLSVTIAGKSSKGG